ncbi:DUF1351 domain-containing protein (plasmid) [Fructilactobacillus ixorae]|uniref:DUF1351 domain-containing protein n=1 Tax=Fructilactobacillus ixorae TaxID=1750535 RepID=A0ABY5C5Y8_9LACO|nr:DUF1351 domain-containing protein [Fructilactobacillus ixorae]USS93972.1 DUF1351 domain-containing protein [Fructilactobacillus ixorae]
MENKVVVVDENTNISYQPNTITINGLDDLKAKVKAAAERYNNLVVTDESYKSDKKKKQELNKLKNSLDNYRLQVKREYSKPLAVFDETMKPLIETLKDTVSGIDNQLKHYDLQAKENKRREIEQFIQEVAPNYGVDPATVRIDDKLTNKTVSKKRWQETIVSQLELAQAENQRREQDEQQLNMFAESINVDPLPYLNLLIRGTSLIEVEQFMKQDIEKKKAQVASEKVNKKVVKNKIVDTTTGEVENVLTFSLMVKGTKKKLNALKNFMEINGIDYELERMD